jgi:hypothetical protein
LRTGTKPTTPIVQRCEAVTPGVTGREEALTNIQEAVELYVEDLVEAGDP